LGKFVAKLTDQCVKWLHFTGQFPRHAKLYKEVYTIILLIGGRRNVLEPWQQYVLHQQFKAMDIVFKELQWSGDYGDRKSFLNYWMCLDIMMQDQGWTSIYNVPGMKGQKQRDTFRSMFEKIQQVKIHRPRPWPR